MGIKKVVFCGVEFIPGIEGVPNPCQSGSGAVIVIQLSVLCKYLHQLFAVLSLLGFCGKHLVSLQNLVHIRTLVVHIAKLAILHFLFSPLLPDFTNRAYYSYFIPCKWIFQTFSTLLQQQCDKLHLLLALSGGIIDLAE